MFNPNDFLNNLIPPVSLPAVPGLPPVDLKPVETAVNDFLGQSVREPLSDVQKTIGAQVGDFVKQRAGQAGEVFNRTMGGAADYAGDAAGAVLDRALPEDNHKDPYGKHSIRNKVINNGGPAPLQGYDVGVWVFDEGRGHNVLLGQFNSILITVKNVAEPYLAAGYRQPMYLDGEIQISFSLEKGLLDAFVFQETFGFSTLDFRNRYFRSPRFSLTFAMDPVDWTSMDEDTFEFQDSLEGNGAVDRERIVRTPSGRFQLDFCKIVQWQLGAVSGKSVVATKWEGVAQVIKAIPYNFKNLTWSQVAALEGEQQANGQFKDNRKVRTFHYKGYADGASIYNEIGRKSRAFRYQDQVTMPLYAQDPMVNGRRLVLLQAELNALQGVEVLGSIAPEIRNRIANLRQEIEQVKQLVQDGSGNLSGKRSTPENYVMPDDPALQLVQERSRLLLRLGEATSPDEAQRLRARIEEVQKQAEAQLFGDSFTADLPAFMGQALNPDWATRAVVPEIQTPDPDKRSTVVKPPVIDPPGVKSKPENYNTLDTGYVALVKAQARAVAAHAEATTPEARAETQKALDKANQALWLSLTENGDSTSVGTPLAVVPPKSFVAKLPALNEADLGSKPENYVLTQDPYTKLIQDRATAMIAKQQAATDGEKAAADAALVRIDKAIKTAFFGGSDRSGSDSALGTLTRAARSGPEKYELPEIVPKTKTDRSVVVKQPTLGKPAAKSEPLKYELPETPPYQNPNPSF